MRGAKPHLRIERDVLADAPAPEWLSSAARDEWDRVVPLLVERKILTRADLGTLENYCMSIGLARDMESQIQKIGAVQLIYQIDKEGVARVTGSKKNPAVQVQKDAMNSARMLGAELGVTPVSRSRPTVSGDDDQDGLFDF